MLSVGVVGYGLSATAFHLPLIEASEQFELVAICSSQRDALRVKYPSVLIYSEAEELIKSTELDLVVITAPNHVHYSLTKLCLENSKHVVLEKPMTTTSLEAQELVELSKSKSLILSVFHNRRWDGDYLSVKKIHEQNLIGDIRFFESHFDRFRPIVRQRWREEPGAGSGVWFDLGAHLVDQAIGLFGLPHSLTARCLPLREDSKTTDYFHVLLHYKNLEVVLHASSFSAGPNRRFHIEGTKGSFVKYGLDPQEMQLKNGMLPTDSGFGIEDSNQFGTLYSETESSLLKTEPGVYLQYYSGIANAINKKGDSPVSCEDAARIIRLLELAEYSSRNGITVGLDTFID